MLAPQQLLAAHLDELALRDVHRDADEPRRLGAPVETHAADRREPALFTEPGGGDAIFAMERHALAAHAIERVGHLRHIVRMDALAPHRP